MIFARRLSFHHFFYYLCIALHIAPVAELVDALDLGSSCYAVQVRVLSGAQFSRPNDYFSVVWLFTLNKNPRKNSHVCFTNDISRIFKHKKRQLSITDSMERIARWRLSGREPPSKSLVEFDGTSYKEIIKNRIARQRRLLFVCRAVR